MPTFLQCASRRARGARASARLTIAVDVAQIHGTRGGTPVATVVLGMMLVDLQRFRPSPAVRASVSEDGLVLLDVEGGLVLTSNAVGARIWRLLEQDSTTGEIAQQIATDYAISLERAQRDVVTFIAALRARALVAGDPRR